MTARRTLHECLTKILRQGPLAIALIPAKGTCLVTAVLPSEKN